MRNRKQQGQIIRIGDRWYVRYWERRNIGGTVERKRVTHSIGEVMTRGKRPPADIKTEAERHMATVNSGTVPAERIVTIGDFVERVYLPWTAEHKRPSTAKGYRDSWEDHLRPLSEQVWLKDTRTYHVQGWLNQIGAGKLSRNTLKHIKSVVSGIFTLAKQQDYFQGENPARDSSVNPKAAEAQETYAYSLEEIQSIRSVLPEPAATAFAVAAFMCLRHATIPKSPTRRIPEGQGWSGARRALGSNFYRLAGPEMVIQRILPPPNLNRTETYYTKTAADDVKHAMEKLENNIPTTIPPV